MNNYNITKIKLLAIIENILSYTSEPSIRIPCEKLKEGIEKKQYSI